VSVLEIYDLRSHSATIEVNPTAKFLGLSFASLEDIILTFILVSFAHIVFYQCQRNLFMHT